MVWRQTLCHPIKIALLTTSDDINISWAKGCHWHMKLVAEMVYLRVVWHMKLVAEMVYLRVVCSKSKYFLLWFFYFWNILVVKILSYNCFPFFLFLIVFLHVKVEISLHIHAVHANPMLSPLGSPLPLADPVSQISILQWYVQRNVIKYFQYCTFHMCLLPNTWQYLVGFGIWKQTL